jgi:hypothetical protein
MKIPSPHIQMDGIIVAENREGVGVGLEGLG